MSSSFGEIAGNLVKRWATSGETALAKSGPFSEMLTGILRQGKELMSQLEGGMHVAVKDDFKELATKGPAAAKEYIDFFDKGIVPTDPDVALTAVKHKNMMFNLRQEYTKTPGTKVAPAVQGNYFPEMYPEGTFDPGKRRDEMIKHLVNTNQARNEAQASQILGFRQGVEPPLARPFHNIEEPRKFTLPGYRKDIGVIYDYLTRGSRRLGEIKTFGQNGEKLETILSAIRQTEGDSAYTFARAVASDELGHSVANHPGVAERALRAYEGATKLGLSFLSNTFQAVNAPVVVGGKAFLKGVAQTFKDPATAADYAEISGASIHQAVRDMRRITGAENTSLLSQTATKLYLNPAENLQRNDRWLRTLMSNVGQVSAQQEFNKLKGTGSDLARRRLTTLGIDTAGALKRGALNNDDILRAGYNMSRIGAFEHSALEMPQAWRDSAAARIGTMYKGFFFIQAKFLKDQILKPALGVNGPRDLRPLMWAMAVWPSVGEISADLKMLARGRDLSDRPDNPITRVIDNVSQLGAFGIMQDTTTALTSGSPLTTYQFLTGPVFGDVVDTMSLPGASAEAKGRYFARKIPIVGPAIASQLFPAKAK